MTDAGETADEIHAADAESAEELVVGWHLDVEAVLVGRAAGGPTAFLEFIAVQRICRGGSFINFCLRVKSRRQISRGES